jgi:hypothetical protein
MTTSGVLPPPPRLGAAELASQLTQVGARFAGRLLAGRALAAGGSDSAAAPAGEGGPARPWRLPEVAEEAEAEAEAEEGAEGEGAEEASVGYMH